MDNKSSKTYKREYFRQWREEHREQVAKASHEYYLKHKEYYKKQGYNYYHDNNYKLYHREYYRRNKERINYLKKLRLQPSKDYEANQLKEAIKQDMTRDINFELNIGEQQFFI
jgi:hypothetical protein